MMDNVNSGNLQNIMGAGMLKNAEMMKNTSGESAPKMPKPEVLPGPYCANGAAGCKGLDFSKMRICSGCQVFKT